MPSPHASRGSALLLTLLLSSVGGLGCSPTVTVGKGSASTGSASGSSGGTHGSSGSSGSAHGSSGSTGHSSSGGSSGTHDAGCGLQTCSSVGANCGPIGNGCGGILECGDCTAPESCGGGGSPSVCGGQSGCAARTCASVGATCGPVGDGCGLLLQCGDCTAPETCGGGGVINVCGTSTVVDGGVLGSDGGCVPRSCTDLGFTCGQAGDGCGGTLSCGTCTSPQSCGAGGQPSVCAMPTSICVPATCATLGIDCGAAADGCGNLLQCSTCTAPDSCGGGGVPNHCGSLSADGGVLVISPATLAMVVQNGTPATAQLTAQFQQGGTSTTVIANWSSSRPDLASVDQTGLLTALGPEGGAVTITAGYLGLLATAQVTVTIAQQTCLPDCTTAPPGAFGTTPVTGTGQSPSFLYPYDQTVIPVNLQPLNFQWQPGSGNDLYQLTVTGTLGSLVAYVSPTNPAQPSFAFDASVWEPFAHSNIGQSVTVSLVGTTSSAPGTTYAAPSQQLILASSRMAGTIYYWAVSAGAILSIPAGGSTATPVYLPPASGGSQCIACHSVSPDGTKMSATLYGGGGPGTVINLFSDGGGDALVTPDPANVGGSTAWDFSTFDSTGQLMVAAHNGNFTLRSAMTGAPVPSSSTEGNLTSLNCGPGSQCTHPVWSRDGEYLLFANVLAGDFTTDYSFTASDLELSEWSSATQTFSAPTTIVPNNYDGNVLANAYPTMSVDDALVAFTRTLCSYASDGSGCEHSSALAMLPTGGGTPIALTKAETLQDGSVDDSSRFPNFSPFKEGGYHWMAFFSLRQYGWVSSNTRQIWVSAIDDNPSPGADTSHPGFWLPGQNPTTMNDKAEWATLPCVGQGQGCQGDIDCCGSPTSLVCQYSGGSSTCEPPQGACGFWGSTCSSSADCCSPSQCEMGLCCTPLTCAQLNLQCGLAGDGCGGTITCGTCTNGQSCGGGGTPNVCGDVPCTPRTCAQQAIDCGPAGDGCGGPLDCGGCDGGTCGGNGVPGQCGSGVHCIPTTCLAQGLNCGPTGDGCGNTLDCGDCTGGLTCGGAGTPGQCGLNPCTPGTCRTLDYNCGEAGDGCGNVIQCGSCPTDGGLTCGGGGHANVCGSTMFK